MRFLFSLAWLLASPAALLTALEAPACAQQPGSPEAEAKQGTHSPPVVVVEKPPPAEKPVYKKWWLWTAAAVVVVAGVGIGLSVGLSSSNNSLSAKTDLGTYKPF